LARDNFQKVSLELQEERQKTEALAEFGEWIVAFRPLLFAEIKKQLPPTDPVTTWDQFTELETLERKRSKTKGKPYQHALENACLDIGLQKGDWNELCDFKWLRNNTFHISDTPASDAIKKLENLPPSMQHWCSPLERLIRIVDTYDC